MTGLQNVGNNGEGMAIRSTAVETQFSNALAFSSSELFRRTFEEGMAMVEETATYLDGRGRQESKLLPSKAALAYAGESMRLTTRLMQVASWLLVQRAVSEREMTADEAAKEKYRLGAREICRGKRMEAIDLLPAKLVELLERSAHLYERVDRLDQALYTTADAPAAPGMHAQLNKLQAAFGGIEAL
jgi:regulator of CtrA degradation